MTGLQESHLVKTLRKRCRYDEYTPTTILDNDLFYWNLSDLLNYLSHHKMFCIDILSSHSDLQYILQKAFDESFTVSDPLCLKAFKNVLLLIQTLINTKKLPKAYFPPTTLKEQYFMFSNILALKAKLYSARVLAQSHSKDIQPIHLVTDFQLATFLRECLALTTRNKNIVMKPFACLFQQTIIQKAMINPLSPISLLLLLQMTCYLKNINKKETIFHETVAPKLFCQFCGIHFLSALSHQRHLNWHIYLNTQRSLYKRKLCRFRYPTLEWFPLINVKQENVFSLLDQIMPDVLKTNTCTSRNTTKLLQTPLFKSHCLPIIQQNLVRQETLKALFLDEFHEWDSENPKKNVLKLTCFNSTLDANHSVSSFNVITHPVALRSIRDGCCLCGTSLLLDYTLQNGCNFKETEMVLKDPDNPNNPYWVVKNVEKKSFDQESKINVPLKPWETSKIGHDTNENRFHWDMFFVHNSCSLFCKRNVTHLPPLESPKNENVLTTFQKKPLKRFSSFCVGP